jgi:hypothetical protein
MKIAIADELRSVLRLGVLRLGAIRLPVDGGDALWAEIERVSAELAGRYAGLTAGQIPETGETRKLYRAVGLDPTKTRPSSEALLRRIVKGKPLYRVHPLVDLFNLVSVTAQLSVGLYAAARAGGSRASAAVGSTWPAGCAPPIATARSARPRPTRCEHRLPTTPSAPWRSSSSTSPATRPGSSAHWTDPPSSQRGISTPPCRAVKSSKCHLEGFDSLSDPPSSVFGAGHATSIGDASDAGQGADRIVVDGEVHQE